MAYFHRPLAVVDCQRGGHVCGGRGLAIYQMVRDASAFGPEDIACLGAAYEAALQLLRLTDRTDPLTQIVAKKIIEVYRDGEHDPPRLCARAVKELGIELPE